MGPLGLPRIKRKFILETQAFASIAARKIAGLGGRVAREGNVIGLRRPRQYN